MSRPLILVSNDDGYQAEGILALGRSLKRWANIIVVAPDREQSASSHSLTLHRPLRIRRHAADLYSVDGTPTDCILLAVHRILKRRPSLIVSGINHGANLGDDVHYSGTVSAAVEGTLLGIPSVAFSLVVWGEEKPLWPVAGSWAARIVRKLLQQPPGRGVALNVNIPNRKTSLIRGIRFTRLGKRNYGEVIFAKSDPRGRRYYWIGGDERSFREVPGSDCEAILEKRVSITPLRVDLTDHDWLKSQRWR